MEAEESHVWSLIIRKLSGEATEVEREELKDLLRTQPDWQYAYEILRNWWSLEQGTSSQEEAERSLRRMKERAGLGKRLSVSAEESTVPLLPAHNKTSFKKRRVVRWGLAITPVLLAVCIGVYFLPGSGTKTASGIGQMPSDGLREVSARYGSRTKAELPDGTLVWLNSGSRLTYHGDRFRKGKREASLAGEAFFDVKHDADRPFVIHAGKINIRVLGTAFDVKSYPEESTSEATLIQGAIEVSFADQPESKVRLKPNQKLVVRKDGGMMIAQHPDTTKGENVLGYDVYPVTFIPEDSVLVETSWVQDKLAFRSEAFVDLARQMERWYNVKIHFKGREVQQYRFTGIFMNESLEEALQALQITAPFHYHIEKNEVFISNDP